MYTIFIGIGPKISIYFVSSIKIKGGILKYFLYFDN